MRKPLQTLIFFAIGLAVFDGLIMLSVAAANSANTYDPDTVIPPVTEAKTRLLFEGTVFWGRRTNTLARNSELGVKYPFAQLDTLHRENYQAWIANLECPITSNEHTEYEEEELLIFNCSPDYLEEAAKYYSAFSLGTNHADNWGEEGIVETKNNLAASGIQYFGHYRYDNGTENCGILSIPIEATLEDGFIYEYNIPVGFCSAHGVFGIPTEAAFANIEKYASVLPTIVMPHMGVEYENSSDELRRNLFRGMIDRGADMVLADHPHHVQNAEAYNGHLIVYSMGNFMFDQQFDETVYSAAIDITGTLPKETDFEAWDNVAYTCLKKHGDCLEDIKNSGLPRLDITWGNYDFVATTDADNIQTRLGDENVRAFVGNRLNWDNVVNNLK
ncbi:CapA family protein [Candidatus Saccharibacteria bacterium]|nr:CapA family protein [Candidatus Saccharibacteria bacterium]